MKNILNKTKNVDIVKQKSIVHRIFKKGIQIFTLRILNLGK